MLVLDKTPTRKKQVKQARQKKQKPKFCFADFKLEDGTNFSPLQISRIKSMYEQIAKTKLEVFRFDKFEMEVIDMMIELGMCEISKQSKRTEFGDEDYEYVMPLSFSAR